MKSFKVFVEDFNISPRSKAINGRPMPSPGPNINFTGAIPSGFKGAGSPGIAPGAEQTILLKQSKKKIKKDKKRKY